MKAMFIAITAIVLTACGNSSGKNDVTVSGQVDLNVQDNLTQCEVRQNGTTLFVRQTGLDPYTFAFDAAVAYDDAWMTLNVADAKRITPLTQTETDIINGVQ